MRAVEWVVAVASIVVVIGIVLGITRWSFRVHERHRRIVAQTQESLEHVAETLGLECVPGPHYDHPMVGRVPSFAHVRGILHGVQVELRVVSDDSCDTPTRFWMELRAALERQALVRTPRQDSRYQLERRGSALVMIPKAAPTGSSHAYLYRLVRDPASLVALLQELVAMVKRQEQADFPRA